MYFFIWPVLTQPAGILNSPFTNFVAKLWKPHGEYPDLHILNENGHMSGRATLSGLIYVKAENKYLIKSFKFDVYIILVQSAPT